MNAEVFAAITIAVLVVLWIVCTTIARERKQAPSPSPSPTTGTTPYRSSTPPTETAKAAEDAKPAEPPAAPLPEVVVDWAPYIGNAPFGYTCPACKVKWQCDRMPKLCACNECDATHFHAKCSGKHSNATDYGCGLNWIMRSALPKPPIITPPPGTTGTKEPS